ncbi:SET domain-containing protein 5 [Gnomoniopsis smithogilvyi]|uniref:SET domain-containing protein 5 n=1 Tax=Gnomoniopsis smithogilvyi TaxID=1191159 RepID=A0A9W8YSZ5_9PEZI|nr:SET domain-containing protein 5 [Gnomoniopsis smithogilvyi]
MAPVASVLLACVVSAALAHEISGSLQHHHVHEIPGYCHSPILRSFPLLSSPVCSNDTLTTKYQASPSHSGWTRATSCSTNANGTDEYCVFVSSTFANGRGLGVVMSPERADYIASLPSFTSERVLKRENKDYDPESTPYKFVHVPGKDMGVVATRPIFRGEHLMSHTPAVVIDYGAFDHLSQAEVLRLQTEVVDQLPSSLRAKFLDLSTHDGASDHVERVEKILKTNAFDVDISDDREHGLYVVFPEISRFNHDCRPNADYWFDPETLVQHVYATRTIVPGEEISLTYMDPIRPRAKRQQKLHNVWGFKCSCSLCTQRPELTAASDQRIKQIKKIRKQLEVYSTESAATPQMADLFVSLYEQERLDGSIHEAYAFAAIEWNGVGEPWQAVRYARLAIEYGLAAVGPRDQDVIEMKSLTEDPWAHWSWMLRTRKRMSWGRMKEVSGSYMRGGDEEDEEDD